MEHLEYPTYETWDQRRRWFEDLNEEYFRGSSCLVSDQACAILADVQSAFCAGAWAAVIVLSMSVVDAQLRETEVIGFRGGTKKLLVEAGANQKLQQLRKRRNALVHVDPSSPALTVDQQYADRGQLEDEAREAVRLMFEAFYMGAGT